MTHHKRKPRKGSARREHHKAGALDHLAQDDDLRHRLTAKPQLWPKAVEEFIRLYPLVYQDGRLVKQDIDFHGLQLRKGDIVWLGLGSANHAPKKFAQPRSFDLDRDQLNHHLAFGAGIHRCLGVRLMTDSAPASLQQLLSMRGAILRLPGSKRTISLGR